jgi:hypothetical protein
MKLVTDYLERAAHFESLAAAETNADFKIELEKQALAYHKLAAKRAGELGVSLPNPSIAN